jgi:alkylated DNA nucleotide flippase Atl1
MPKKTWTEKLNDPTKIPEVKKITGKMAEKWGSGTLLIPAPIEVDEFMRKVPKGKITTVNEIREGLAKKHKAKISCPMCTGIFAKIAAEAAEEQREQGKKNVTPWWRTLKSDGTLNPKYPIDTNYQKALLEAEGHKIVKKGTRSYTVEGYQKKLKRF